MSEGSDQTRHMQEEDSKERIRRAVAVLVAGTNLRVEELVNELVITNPVNPDAGQIHVAYMDGYVSWERVAWSYWGALEGFEAEGSSGKINAAEIIAALTPQPDVFTGLAHP